MKVEGMPTRNYVRKFNITHDGVDYSYYNLEKKKKRKKEKKKKLTLDCSNNRMIHPNILYFNCSFKFV
jgi:hypothetical protein